MSPGPPAPTYTSPPGHPTSLRNADIFLLQFCVCAGGDSHCPPAHCPAWPVLRPWVAEGFPSPGIVGYKMVACHTSLSWKESSAIWPVDTAPLSLRPLLGCLLHPKSWPSDSLPGPLTPGSQPPQPSCFHSRDMAPSPRPQSVRPLCSLPNQCPSSFSKGPFCPHENPPCFPSSPTCAPALAPSACQPSLPCPPGSFQLLPSPICVPQRQEGQRGRPGSEELWACIVDWGYR